MKHENPPSPHNLILLTKNVINEPVYVCLYWNCLQIDYHRVRMFYGFLHFASVARFFSSFFPIFLFVLRPFGCSARAGTDIWNGGTNVGYDLFVSVPSAPQVCSARWCARTLEQRMQSWRQIINRRWKLVSLLLNNGVSKFCFTLYQFSFIKLG